MVSLKACRREDSREYVVGSRKAEDSREHVVGSREGEEKKSLPATYSLLSTASR